jgi:hypothetical protein
MSVVLASPSNVVETVALQGLADLPWPVFVIVPLVVLGVIFGAILAHRAEKRRIAELKAWAGERGFHYTSGRAKGAPHVPFELFERGHSRYADHQVNGRLVDALRGLDDPSFELFHYHYAITTGSGKDRRTRHYHHRCLLLDLGFAVGEIDVRPENFFDKLAAVVGFDDIDVEDPHFSKRFHVKARDRRAAYALLEAELTDHLLTAELGFTARGSLVLVAEPGRAEVADYARLLEHVRGLVHAVPRLLVNAERERRGLAPLVDAGSAARRQRPDPEKSATD